MEQKNQKRKSKNNRELLFSVTKKDFDIQWFHGSGAGGQNRNKNALCARIIHRDSGARGECTIHKSREQNKKEAFNKLTKSNIFQMWLKIKAHEMMDSESLEEKVEKSARPENLKVEVKVDGKWVNEKDVKNG